MRGGFNRKLRARYGNRSTFGPPGEIYVTQIPCRRVEQFYIDQAQFPFSLSEVWVTLDAVRLNAPTTISPWMGAVFTDYLTADQVSISNAPDVWFTVCREESVIPFGRPPYWRYLLIPVTDYVVPPWQPPTPIPPKPSSPPGSSPAPGASCADPAFLSGFGEYLLATQPDGTNGYYAIEVPPNTAVRVRYVDGVNVHVASDVHSAETGGDCCAGQYVGQLSPAGVEWVSVGPTSEYPSLGRVCLSVASTSPPFDARMVLVLIDNSEGAP